MSQSYTYLKTILQYALNIIKTIVITENRRLICKLISFPNSIPISKPVVFPTHTHPCGVRGLGRLTLPIIRLHAWALGAHERRPLVTRVLVALRGDHEQPVVAKAYKQRGKKLNLMVSGLHRLLPHKLHYKDKGEKIYTIIQLYN